MFVILVENIWKKVLFQPPIWTRPLKRYKSRRAKSPRPTHVAHWTQNSWRFCVEFINLTSWFTKCRIKFWMRKSRPLVGSEWSVKWPNWRRTWKRARIVMRSSSHLPVVSAIILMMNSRKSSETTFSRKCHKIEVIVTVVSSVSCVMLILQQSAWNEHGSSLLWIVLTGQTKTV